MSRLRRSPARKTVFLIAAALVVAVGPRLGPDQGGQAQGPPVDEPRAPAQGLPGVQGHAGRLEVQGPQVAVRRPDQHQRPGDRRRRRRPQGPELHDLRGLGLRRRLEDGERGHDLDAHLREHGHGGRRRHRPGALRPEHRLGRDRRAQHLPQLPGRRRRLQVGRRRQDLGAHGPGRHQHHLPHRRPPRRIPTSSTSRPAATSGRRTPTAASTRRPTAARPGPRSSSSTTRPGPTTWSWTRARATRSTPRCGSGRARNGTTRGPSRGTPAAASSRRPTAARPGRRSTPGSRTVEFRGRIGIDLCLTKPDTLYALVDNYETARDDHRRSWTRYGATTIPARASSRAPRSTAPTTPGPPGPRRAA